MKEILNQREENMYPMLEKFILIVGLIVSLVFLLEILLHWKRRPLLQSMKSIPTIKHNFPILGHITMLFGGPRKILQDVERILQGYEGNVKGWALHRVYVVVTEVEDIAITLGGSNCLNKPMEYGVLQDSIMRQGLFSSTNLTAWKKNRRLTTPAFHFQVLRSFIGNFYVDATILGNKLIQIMERDGEVEVCRPIGLCTMDMVARNAMGVIVNSQKDSNHVFVYSLEALLNIWHERILKPWYLNKFIFDMSSMKVQHDKATHDVQVFASEVILAKLEERLRKVTDPDGTQDKIDDTIENDDYGQREPKAFLDLLIENVYNGVDEYCLSKSVQQLRETINFSKSQSKQNNYDDSNDSKMGTNTTPEVEKLEANIRNENGAKDEITSKNSFEKCDDKVGQKIIELNQLNTQLRDEACSLLVGGQETTATENSFAVLMLALHQDVQSKVVDELNEIFGEDNRSPTYEDLQKMEYLECVIKESMRLFPSLPAMLRIVEKETVLSNKSVLPKGCNLIYLPYVLHRNPRHFPDPNKFIPERFFPENSQDRHPLSFIPFGAGPRNCIAHRYAMIQMKVILSTLVRAFKILPSDRMPTIDQVRVEMGVTLRAQDGCWVKLERRQSTS